MGGRVARGALPGVVDIVPAARTVLVKLDGPRYPGVDRQRLRKMRVTASRIDVAAPDGGRADVVIDVVYDGPDLAEVGRPHRADHRPGDRRPHRHACGGSDSADSHRVSRIWSTATHDCEVPRRSEPRTSVPAGSVALAGEFSAIYPRQSPGGWQLIGHTDAVLWDLDATRSRVADAGHVGPVPGAR